MEAVAALVPSVGVGFLFYLAIRAVINADRRERSAMAALDKVERERAGRSAVAQQPSAADGSASGNAGKSPGE